MRGQKATKWSRFSKLPRNRANWYCGAFGLCERLQVEWIAFAGLPLGHGNGRMRMVQEG